jgi:hypothetical protein
MGKKFLHAYDSAAYVFPTFPFPARHVFAYVNGFTPETAGTSIAALRKIYNRVILIDVRGNVPHANVLDVETGGASFSDVVPWVTEHVRFYGRDSRARLYTNLSSWPQMRFEVSKLPLSVQRHVRWWIAHPTGSQHIIPGSHATQWFWGPKWDKSTYFGDF